MDGDTGRVIGIFGLSTRAAAFRSRAAVGRLDIERRFAQVEL